MATIDLAQYKYSLILDSSEFDKGMKEAEKSAESIKDKLSNVGSTMKSAFEFGAKAAATAVTAAVGAVATLTGAATKSYAEYEQLIGGVETLFGAGGASIEEYAESVGQSVDDVEDKYNSMMSAQETVFNNAKNAYKTAGLSANEYMDTVTSFSASLIASLDGDTQKAAEYSNRAIVDMSDNANKMGSSMESIQNAYQGFAKQNYTMLDNLKLGYGGTKEEMKRLIADASQMTDVQEKLGLTVDSSSLSFGNIVDAISVMQEHMGIAGTTAREAATTIEGSINMTKASWTNLVTGIADDNANFQELVDNFVESVATAGENLIPRIEIAINGVGTLINDLLPVIMQEVPKIINDILPDLVNAGLNMLNSIGQGINDSVPGLIDIIQQVLDKFLQTIADNLPTVLEKGTDLVVKICDGITEMIPKVIDSGLNIINNLLSGITEHLPRLLDSGMKLIETLVTGFVDKIPEEVSRLMEFFQQFLYLIQDKLPDVITWGFDILVKLIDGILSAIPQIVEKFPQIIETILNILLENFPLIVQKGFELIIKLIEGILSCIPQLIQSIPQIISAIVDTIISFDWLQLGNNILSWFKDGILSEDGNIRQAITNIADSIVDTISSLPEAMWDIGSNIVSGIWEGISDGIGWLTDKLSDFAGGVIDSVKGFFGIHSPSRLMRDEVGTYLAKGIGVGFEDEMADVTKSMQNMLNTDFKLTPQIPNIPNAIAQVTYAVNGGSSKASPTSITYDVNVGDINVEGVNDPKEFAKQLRYTIANDVKTKKILKASTIDQIAGKSEMEVYKYV